MTPNKRKRFGKLFTILLFFILPPSKAETPSITDIHLYFFQIDDAMFLRRLKNEQAMKDLTIEGREEFLRSLLYASPEEQAGKLAASKMTQQRGGLDPARFVNLAPSLREDSALQDSRFNPAYIQILNDNTKLDHPLPSQVPLQLPSSATADSQFCLGLANLIGEGVPQDFSKAFKWFSTASARKHNRAQMRLAECYTFGRGVSKNQSTADVIYLKLANEGYPQAQALMGLILFNRFLNDKNLSTAIQAYKWLSLASIRAPDLARDRDQLLNHLPKQSLAYAQKLAGDFKPVNPGSVTVTEPVAQQKSNTVDTNILSRLVRWQHELATNGSAYAQYELGLRYLKGDGVPTNQLLAAHWLRAASTNGNDEAAKALNALSTLAADRSSK
jgi:TPR repeat protein